MSTYKKFKFEGTLTHEQLDFFNQNGFIHFEKYASQETVDQIIASTEQVQSQWVQNDIQKVNGVPIKYGVDENGKTIVQRFAFTNQYSDAVHRFASHPNLDAL